MTDRIYKVPLTPHISDGQIRFVLTFPDGPEYLDMHLLFKVNNKQTCELFFGMQNCIGTKLNIDPIQNKINGLQTITINNLGSYIYTLAVNKYNDVSGGKGKGDNAIFIPQNITDFDNNKKNLEFNNIKINNYPLKSSRAKVSVYVNGYVGPIKSIAIPIDDVGLKVDTQSNTDLNDWWQTLCLDGRHGINTIMAVNDLASRRPIYTTCENIYTPDPL